MAATFAIHILFEDGSNPYWRRGMTYLELNRERRKWRRNYELEFIPIDSVPTLHIYNYMARLKYPTPRFDLYYDVREGGDSR